MPSPDDLVRTLAPQLEAAAREAGDIALGYFRHGQTTSARVWSKSGGSPVTEADVSVDAFLKIRLSGILPQAGWLSEETVDSPSRLGKRLVWIVDPIDGTRAFLSGHPDWSVAIALLVDDRPLMGIVHAPHLDTLFSATRGGGAALNGEPISVSPAAGLRGSRVAGPKPLIDTLRRRAGEIVQVDRIPSLALRLARIASGEVDIGLVTGNARDWDIAAADLILAEAGGVLTDFSGEHPRYNRSEPLHGELLAASRALHPHVLEAMTAQWRPERVL